MTIYLWIVGIAATIFTLIAVVEVVKNVIDGESTKASIIAVVLWAVVAAYGFYFFGMEISND